LYDGHGSTRQLTDSAGAIVPNESYSYGAYGVMLGGNPTAGNPAATNLLYTGEQYDTSAQSYYLRARYYDPLTGRFNRMDPFAGNMQDPQSLHKYLYCHANPLNGIDPAGLMFFSLVDFLSALGINATLQDIKDLKDLTYKKGVDEVKEELRDALDFREEDPIPAVARAAEELWKSRLTSLGYFVISFQDTPVGKHGPDMLAFGVIDGQFKIIIAEIKGMKNSRILSSLHRLSDGTLQMSAGWIDRYASEIVQKIVGFLGEIACSIIPTDVDDRVADALKSKVGFEFYLLRARYYAADDWVLRGFRLLHVGGTELDYVKGKATNDIEEEYRPTVPVYLPG
jgi:RHS repeat-associated protein